MVKTMNTRLADIQSRLANVGVETQRTIEKMYANAKSIAEDASREFVDSHYTEPAEQAEDSRRRFQVAMDELLGLVAVAEAEADKKLAEEKLFARVKSLGGEACYIIGRSEGYDPSVFMLVSIPVCGVKLSVSIKCEKDEHETTRFAKVGTLVDLVESGAVFISLRDFNRAKS